MRGSQSARHQRPYVSEVNAETKSAECRVAGRMAQVVVNQNGGELVGGKAWQNSQQNKGESPHRTLASSQTAAVQERARKPEVGITRCSVADPAVEPCAAGSSEEPVADTRCSVALCVRVPYTIRRSPENARRTAARSIPRWPQYSNRHVQVQAVVWQVKC